MKNQVLMSLNKQTQRLSDLAVPQLRPPMGWLIQVFSQVGNRPFLQNDQFYWIKDIEAEWKTIKKEFEAVRSSQKIPNIQEVNPRLKFLSSDDRWKTYFFFVFGRKIEQGCQACPLLYQLLKGIPSMQNAFFSILGPGKHIPAHQGKYNGLIRYHLGLQVPNPINSCTIRVGDDFRHWEEGKSMIFDDTYMHEVWNESDEERTVLIIDVMRPLPSPVALMNRTMIQLIAQTSFVQDGQQTLH